MLDLLFFVLMKYIKRSIALIVQVIGLGSIPEYIDFFSLLSHVLTAWQAMHNYSLSFTMHPQATEHWASAWLQLPTIICIYEPCIHKPHRNWKQSFLFMCIQFGVSIRICTIASQKKKNMHYCKFRHVCTNQQTMAQCLKKTLV